MNRFVDLFFGNDQRRAQGQRVAEVRTEPRVVSGELQRPPRQHETLRLGLPVAGAWLVDLLEDRSMDPADLDAKIAADLQAGLIPCCVVATHEEAITARPEWVQAVTNAALSLYPMEWFAGLE